MRVIAIIQARMASSRLPGKVLSDIAGRPVLEQIYRRVSKSMYLNKIIIATSLDVQDDVIEEFCNKKNICCFRGSHTNVLERYYQCAEKYNGDIIVRLTADNAFVDAGIIDEGICSFMEISGLDYLYYREGLPLGLAIEVFSFNALKEAYNNAREQECLEHVTVYMYQNQHRFRCKRFSNMGCDYSKYRLTMDTEEDRILVERLYERLLNQKCKFSYKDVIRELEMYPELVEINSSIIQKSVDYNGEL